MMHCEPVAPNSITHPLCGSKKWIPVQSEGKRTGKPYICSFYKHILNSFLAISMLLVLSSVLVSHLWSLFPVCVWHPLNCSETSELMSSTSLLSQSKVLLKISCNITGYEAFELHKAGLGKVWSSRNCGSSTSISFQDWGMLGVAIQEDLEDCILPIMGVPLCVCVCACV